MRKKYLITIFGPSSSLQKKGKQYSIERKMLRFGSAFRRTAIRRIAGPPPVGVRLAATRRLLSTASDPSAPKSSDRSQNRRWFVGAAAAVFGIFTAGVAYDRHRKKTAKQTAADAEAAKKKESFELQSIILRALSTPYVPPRLDLDNAEELYRLYNFNDYLNNKTESRLLVVNAAPKNGTLEAVQAYIAGQPVIDMSAESWQSAAGFADAVRRLAPELLLRKISSDRLFSETAAALAEAGRSDGGNPPRPIVLLNIPQADKLTAPEWICDLVRTGFRVVIITNNRNVWNNLSSSRFSDGLRKTYTYIVPIPNRAAVVERYLTSAVSPIANRFAKPQDAKSVAAAIGGDKEAIKRLLRFCRDFPSKTVNDWLAIEVFDAKLQWMKAVATMPDGNEECITGLAKNMSFDGVTFRLKSPRRYDDDLLRHLEGCGLLWKPDSSYSDNYSASPLAVLGWQKLIEV